MLPPGGVSQTSRPHILIHLLSDTCTDACTDAHVLRHILMHVPTRVLTCTCTDAYVYWHMYTVKVTLRMSLNLAHVLFTQLRTVTRWSQDLFILKAISTPWGACCTDTISGTQTLFKHASLIPVLPGTHLLLGQGSAHVGKSALPRSKMP